MVVINKRCPICGAAKLPEQQQPTAGTHAFTILYNCGSQIVHVLSGEEIMYKSCKGNK